VVVAAAHLAGRLAACKNNTHEGSSMSKTHYSPAPRRADDAVDALLSTAAIAPPAFWLSVLSTPRLKLQPPSYAELSAAYRYRRTLPIAGALAGLAMLSRGRSGRAHRRVARSVGSVLGGMAALSPLVYDPFLFSPRRTRTRVRPATETGDVFEGDDTEVLGVLLDGEARAYPARKAARPHFIADTLAGQPLVISYCGLTNSAIAYRAGDGLARELPVVSAPNNNILYWDEATGSLVQQLRPERVHGEAAGEPLRTLPVVYTTWGAWRRLAPDTTIADTAWESKRDHLISRVMRAIHMRIRVTDEPFLAVAGGMDETVHPKAQVLALSHQGDSHAYTRGFLREHAQPTTPRLAPAEHVTEPGPNIEPASWSVSG
jgi:hypothetical protein